MEKRFTSKQEDNNVQDTPDQKTRMTLLIVSGVLILGISIAVIVAMVIRGMNKPEPGGETTQMSTTGETDVPGSSFGAVFPEGVVPTQCMSLKWKMSASDIKVEYPDILSEAPSTLEDEKNTVNISYSRKSQIGGFDFSIVTVSADKADGLYAFSYLLDKDRYSDILAALTEEFDKPVFKSGESAYWEMEGDVLVYLTVRVTEVDGKEHSFLQYIYTKEAEKTEKPDVFPSLKLGMTVKDVQKLIKIQKSDTAADGTETYTTGKEYDISQDPNMGRFTSGKASNVFLSFNPRIDLYAYSFIIPGNHLYDIREKLAREYGNPVENRDYSSQWNVLTDQAVITVTFGRMRGSGRGFATEIKYSCSAEGYRTKDLIKAVGRATRKGLTYQEVKDEIGMYNPSERITKGTGTITLVNYEAADIIVFGVRIRSVEIEFTKNKVTAARYIFDGSAYDALKRNIEQTYGSGRTQKDYKDSTNRVLWYPEPSETLTFNKILLDTVKTKSSTRARLRFNEQGA